MSGAWIVFSEMRPARRENRYGIDFFEPQVMTIVNVTPDSFFDGSRTPDFAAIAERVARAVAEGCSIVDVGGYSSRPGADEVPVEEEWRRVETGIRAVRSVSREIPVSVDTFRSEVAERAICLDYRIIINDISAGEIDPDIVRVAVANDVPYVAMHMRGTPATMQTLTGYADTIAEVEHYFASKVDALMSVGMRPENIVLDPGFGFAKTTDENYELLGGLNRLRALGFPLLGGVSRKSMIYKVLGVTPTESLAGTIALNWEMLRQGVTVLRVHDTREAVDTVRIFERYVQNGWKHHD